MMNFFKKILSKASDNVKETKQDVKNITIEIDLSREAMEKHKEASKLEQANIWQYNEPKIDFYDSTGNPVYERVWVNQSERNVVEFFGVKTYSENKMYCIVGTMSNNYNFNIALVDVAARKVLFKHKYKTPSIYAVSNSGKIAFVERHPNSDKLSILDKDGNKIFEKRHNSFISEKPFNFPEDNSQFIYELHTTHKMITIDL